jgi:hypothetical protein
VVDRRRTTERLAVGLAAVVAMALVLVAPVHVSSAGLAVGEACAEASTSQATVPVGVVIDFGVLRGAGDPGSQVVTCVPVASGVDGFAMLTAAGHQFRVNDAGLALRQELEDRTNELSCVAWRMLGEATTVRFLDLVEPVGERLLARIDETAGPNWMPAARERRT